MNHNATIISAIQHLKMADEYFANWQRDNNKGSKGYHMFRNFRERIAWIFKSFLSCPFYSDDIRAALKQEIETEAVFSIMQIHHDIALLPPHKREAVEELIAALISGEDIRVEKEL